MSCACLQDKPSPLTYDLCHSPDIATIDTILHVSSMRTLVNKCIPGLCRVAVQRRWKIARGKGWQLQDVTFTGPTRIYIILNKNVYYNLYPLLQSSKVFMSEAKDFGNWRSEKLLEKLYKGLWVVLGYFLTPSPSPNI